MPHKMKAKKRIAKPKKMIKGQGFVDDVKSTSKRIVGFLKKEVPKVAVTIGTALIKRQFGLGFVPAGIKTRETRTRPKLKPVDMYR
jgi:hypothetical protein